MKGNDSIIMQKEIGTSSWFGFSIVLSEKAKFKREELIAHLEENNVEVRPIVAGNFTKNEVIKYFDHSLHGEMVNAEYIDQNGFFIGNHHVDLNEKLEQVANLINSFCESK